MDKVTSLTSSKKMKLRASIVAILNNYRGNNEVSATQFREDVEKLKSFNSDEDVCKMLLKEIMDTKSSYTNTCAIMAMECTPNDIFDRVAKEYIKDAKNSDELKFFILSLMKQKGLDINYNEFFTYIKEPDKIAQNGVKDFLVNALDDPEVQIDFLDFYLNIEKRERLYLLGNIIEEAEGDDLANTLSLLVQINIDIEELELAIDGLIKSNSPYALVGLNYILDNYDLEKQDVLNIKKTIKKINFANRDWEDVSLVQNSTHYKSYIGFVDGKGNFSLIFSRKRQTDDLIDCFLLTINVLDGINGCMGFGKITDKNFETIVKRLYVESMPVETTPVALRGLIDFFYEKNIKNKINVPYEFVVWKKLLADVRKLNYDVSELITSKLNSVTLNDEKLKKILSAKLLETRYYSVGQSPLADRLINDIEEIKEKNFGQIQRVILRAVTRDFISNEDYIRRIKNMLLIQAYVAHLAHLQMSSAYAYSICFDIKFIKKLTESMLDKTVYYYLSTCLMEIEDDNNNLFVSKPKTTFSEDELSYIMEQFEKKWQ